MNELLAKYNINRNSLTTDELITLEKWAKAITGKQISVYDVSQYINSMIEKLEMELHGYDTKPMTFANLFFSRRRNRHLEARLMNYVMLRDFLTAPERARSYVEKQLESFAPKK